MRKYISYCFITLVLLFLANCVNHSDKKDTENTRIKASDIYELNVNATCTILTDIGQGSGFFIDSNVVVTNYHVIQGAHEASITLNDRKQTVKVLGFLGIDKFNDLALLQVDCSNTCVIEIIPTTPKPGDQVYAIGSPNGFAKSITDGMISGKRNFEGRTLIQTTVAISHGSSGSPILNDSGELIGVAVGGVEQANDIYFCIPANQIKNLLQYSNTYPSPLSDEIKINKEEPKEKNKLIVEEENSVKPSPDIPNKTTFINNYKKASRSTEQNIMNWLYNSSDKDAKYWRKQNLRQESMKYYAYNKSWRKKHWGKTYDCIKFVISFQYTTYNGDLRYAEITFDENYNLAQQWTGLAPEQERLVSSLFMENNIECK